MSMKNSNDAIGNQTRDLLACSTVPQPTALLCSPVASKLNNKMLCLPVNILTIIIVFQFTE